MSSWRLDESHPRRITKHHSIGGACSSHACPACSSDEPPSRHQQLVHGSSQSYTEWNVVGGSGGNVGGVSSRNLSIDLNESGSGSSNKSPHANELGESAPHATAGIRPSQSSTCVEPDHRELIRSVSVVLHRRIRDNEDAESKLLLPLFCEDTHTEAPPEPTYEVSMPTLPVQALGFVSLYTLTELPPPPVIPRVYDVPDVATVCDFIENIWHRARLTPQSVVICLIYVDRLEARSAGVLLHARSWRPIVFASLLLASKVWHDVSYWNSDFSSICPMFNLRNINRMELAYLKLLEYNTIISSSQYAQYYFSLRHALRQIDVPIPSTPSTVEPAPAEGAPPTPPTAASSEASPVSEALEAERVRREAPARGGGPSGYNFRSKYFMAINVPGAARLQAQTEALATDGPGSKLVPPCGEEDEEVAEEPPRPRALLAAQTREHDRQVARMHDASSAALPPWMRPPSRPETPVEAGAAAAAPLWNLEGGGSPGAAQSRPMTLKSKGLQPLPLEKSFSTSPPAEGTVGRRGKRPSQGFAGSL